MMFLYYGECFVECEFVCELLVLSCTIVHAETDDVALFRITVFEGFVFESCSNYPVCRCLFYCIQFIKKSLLHTICYS